MLKERAWSASSILTLALIITRHTSRTNCTTPSLARATRSRLKTHHSASRKRRSLKAVQILQSSQVSSKWLKAPQMPRRWSARTYQSSLIARASGRTSVHSMRRCSMKCNLTRWWCLLVSRWQASRWLWTTSCAFTLISKRLVAWSTSSIASSCRGSDTTSTYSSASQECACSHSCTTNRWIESTLYSWLQTHTRSNSWNLQRMLIHSYRHMRFHSFRVRSTSSRQRRLKNFY